MQQNDIDIIISRYLAGEATDEEIKQLNQWLDYNDENRREFMHQKGLWDAMNLPFDVNDIDIDAAQKHMLNEIGGKIEHPNRGFYYWWARTASVIALPLILACAILLYINIYVSDDSADNIQTLSTSYGSTMQFQLPDGSAVWLNANSSLSYNLNMKDKRNLRLKGEAYFEVHADKNRPFIVNASGLKVTATGTAFNINAYENDSKTIVTLVNGKVSAQTPDDESLKMAPGQQLVYDSQTDIAELSNVDTYNWYAWKDGKIIFRDAPLGDVFKRLSQIYNVDFIIESQDINNYTCRATFEGENLTEILHLIELTAPINYNYIEGSQEISNNKNKQYHITLNNHRTGLIQSKTTPDKRF